MSISKLAATEVVILDDIVKGPVSAAIIKRIGQHVDLLIHQQISNALIGGTRTVAVRGQLDNNLTVELFGQASEGGLWGEIELTPPLPPLEPEPPPVCAIRWQTPVPAYWFIDPAEGRDFPVEPTPSREARFNALRAEGKKLGEINAILEAEGFSEVSGEGVMPCPTKSHEIVRENKGAKQMITSLE